MMLHRIVTTVDTLKHKFDNTTRLENGKTAHGTGSGNPMPLPTVCHALINMQNAMA